MYLSTASAVFTRTGHVNILHAYTRVNLINNMIEIFFRFKTYKYVMLGDIRKAFQMIKLNRFDKNRFRFFVKDGDELLC